MNFESQDISWGRSNELLYVIFGCLLAGTLAKIPAILSFEPEYFYTRNVSFVILPVLCAYFLWKNNASSKRTFLTFGFILLSVIFVNLLPNDPQSDTLNLACIHIPLFLWTILGTSFASPDLNDYSRRIDFLRYNGDLLVMTAIILLAGGIMTGITIGLFHLIDIDISKFYIEYIGIYGLSAAPIVGTFLTQTNPQLVNKVSPIIAKLFTPLVLVTLVVYLVAIVVSGKDPYNDREFLLIFNLLLLGVMALILFSVAETTKSDGNRWGVWVLFALSVVTILVNAIALSAIVFRISEWGITPNRMAVLGANLLILFNLTLVSIQIYKACLQRIKLSNVEIAIARFLPYYGIWAIIVGFVFPVIFKFR